MKIVGCASCVNKIIVENIAWCKVYNKKIDFKEVLICYKYKKDNQK
ncbi:hypothetical protein [Desulfosporosinus sp. FKA]|nr:hypothetical protein [Desulfosporosinus sp. FKA]